MCTRVKCSASRQTFRRTESRSVFVLDMLFLVWGLPKPNQFDLASLCCPLSTVGPDPWLIRQISVHRNKSSAILHSHHHSSCTSHLQNTSWAPCVRGQSLKLSLSILSFLSSYLKISLSSTISRFLSSSISSYIKHYFKHYFTLSFKLSLSIFWCSTVAFCRAVSQSSLFF